MSSSRTLLIDASPLLYASRIDRLDVLGSLLQGYECLTTQAVLEEVERNDPGGVALDRVRSAPWLGTAPTDTLAYHGKFLQWSQWLKMTPDHNIGETTLCTYADVHGGTVYMDDNPARKVAERRGLTVRGTAGLVADGCCEGTWTAKSASSFMDDLADVGSRFPFPRGGFEVWAVKQGLLPAVPGPGKV